MRPDASSPIDQPDDSTFSQVKSEYCFKKRIRIKLMQTVLFKTVRAGQRLWREDLVDLQETETEDAHQDESLPPRKLKLLDHWNWEHED